jgi:hypothetical protein
MDEFDVEIVRCMVEFLYKEDYAVDLEEIGRKRVKVSAEAGSGEGISVFQ